MLQEATTTKYENCCSMEDYVSRIISATKKLATIGTTLPDDLVGALLLAGLPLSYKPMIMALSNSGMNITGDFVKNKLLEEPETVTAESEFETRDLHTQAHTAHFESRNGAYRGRGSNYRARGSQRNSSTRCFNCNKLGHISSKCKAPRRNNSNANACTASADEESESEDTVCALFAALPARPTHTVTTQITSADSEMSEANPDDALLAVGLLTTTNKSDWFLDSGASTHMCCQGEHFTNTRPPKIKTVTAANKAKIPVEIEGDICMRNSGSVGCRKILLQNVLHIPDLTANLVSVSAIAKQGGEVIFRENKCQVRDKAGSVLLEGCMSNNNIYLLNLQPSFHPAAKKDNLVALKVTQNTSMSLWHRRMGHLNPNYLKLLCKTAVGIQFSDKELCKCEVCVAGKLTNKPFKANNNRAPKILQLVHSNVCQVEDLSIGKVKYFVTFLDDHSRKIFVYMIKRKDEVPDIVLKFIALAENQTGEKLKVLRIDNGRVYLNSKLQSSLEKMGIQHQTSMAYHPQQNGRAERINRTLLEKTRCMLAKSKLSNKFWAEAVSTACFLANRSPKRCLDGCTPEEIWSGQKPDLSSLKVFGCRARAFIPSHLRKKIGPTSRPGIMLGYCEKQKGYRLWSHEEQKVFTASNVEFIEEEPSRKLKSKTICLPLDNADIAAGSLSKPNAPLDIPVNKTLEENLPLEEVSEKSVPKEKNVLEEDLPLEELHEKNVPENKILPKNLPVQEVQKPNVPAKKAPKRRSQQTKL